MAEGDIASIRISATANTQDATRKLTNLSNLLTELQQKINALSFPSRRIDALASSLAKLNNLKLGADFTKSMTKVTESLQQMNAAIADPEKAKALGQQLSGIAKLTEATRLYTQAQNAQKMQDSKLQEQQAKAAAAEARLQTAKERTTQQAAAAQAAAAKAQAKAQAESARAQAKAQQEEAKAQQKLLTEKARQEAEIARKEAFDARKAAVESEASARRPRIGTGDTGKNLDTATAKAHMLYNALSKIVSIGAMAFKGLETGAIKAAGALGQLVAKMAVAPYTHLAKSIGNIVSKLKGFFAAVKRIAIYRAIRAALKALTQAFKEGVSNLYQYSKALNGEFAKSMDSIATSSLYLKNSLGAMVSPLINSLAPALDVLVDKFVELLNKANQLFATLRGATTWTAALKYPKEYAEATDKANGKAKELRKTLLSFDEINRLDDNNKGSRGSAAEELDYSKMFEERTVTTKAKQYVDAIKKAFKEGDFTNIGKNIGTSLKKGLDSINWDAIKDRVNKNASSIATLINGFISVPGLADSIGRTVAEAFNTAVGKINTFFGTVHWDELGQFLGSGVNSVLTNFDIEALARGLAGIVNSGFSLISNFINTVDWEYLGEFLSTGINNFFDELNTKNIGETISNGVIAAIKLVHTFFKNVDFEKIGEKIGEIVKNIDWVKMFKGLAQIIWDAVKSAAELIKGIVEESPVFATALASLVAYKIATALGAATITSTISGALSKAILGSSTAAAGGAAGASGLATAGKAGLVAGAAVGGYAAGKWLSENTVVGEVADSAMETVFGKVETKIDRDKYKDEEYYRNLAMKQAKNAAKEEQKRLEEIKKTYGATPGSYYGYASGGTPATGSLFLAGESGAEIISSQSGRTSVSNRDQIAESVAQGNEEGNALLREQNDLLRRLLAKDTTVAAYISTDSIVSGLDRKNRRDGRTAVPVGV